MNLSEQKIQPVYLIKGDDSTLVAQSTSTLVRELVGPNSSDLIVEELPDDEHISSVLDSCQTPSLLADMRVVVVPNAGRFRADEVEPLIEYLSQPVQSTVLVLIGGGGQIPTRLVKSIKEHGHIVEASQPNVKNRQAWLSERLRSAPVKFDRSAAAVISEKITDEYGQLQGLFDALASAYGEGAVLSAKEVEPYLGEAGASAPWELTDAIDSGNTKLALNQLRRLINNGTRHPLVVTAILQRHVSNLLRLDGANITNETQAAEILGVAAYPAKKALLQSQKLGSNAVKRAISLVHEADVDLRGRSAWSNELTLEVLVARLSKLSTGSQKRRK